MDRPMAIADAGVALIANRGIRALTHHAIDDELGIARGSTSYYARTRRDLIALIVNRLTQQRQQELTQLEIPEAASPTQVARAISKAIHQASQHPEQYLARMALLLELPHDADLRKPLSEASPIRAEARTVATQILTDWGVTNPQARAEDLIGVIDGLLSQTIVRGADLDLESILRAYLVGLLPKSGPAGRGSTPQTVG